MMTNRNVLLDTVAVPADSAMQSDDVRDSSKHTSPPPPPPPSFKKNIKKVERMS